MTFYLNAERYYDPTAGAALNEVEKGENMEWEVGDIVSASREGSPVEKKFLVMANDGYVLTVLELLSREMGGCVPVVCTETMFVNPYRLTYVSLSSNTVQRVKTATAEELARVRLALRKVFGFGVVEPEAEEPEEDDGLTELLDEQAKQLIEANAKADVYKGLYEELLMKCLKTA